MMLLNLPFSNKLRYGETNPAHSSSPEESTPISVDAALQIQLGQFHDQHEIILILVWDWLQSTM